MSSFRRQLLSFKYAITGLFTAWRSEWNLKVHALAVVVVLIAGIMHGCTRMEWVALTFAITMVVVAEVFNTALEYLADHSSGGQQHPLIRHAKDIAAGAVLLAAAGAVVVALLIFL